jgi:hypothetical protein
MHWTYVRNGHRRACGLRQSGCHLLLEVRYEFADSPIVESFPAIEPSLCAQLTLERAWVDAGWSLDEFTGG